MSPLLGKYSKQAGSRGSTRAVRTGGLCLVLAAVRSSLALRVVRLLEVLAGSFEGRSVVDLVLVAFSGF